MNNLAAITPNTENSLTLFLVCRNDLLNSFAFAYIVLFASRVAATKLSTMLLDVLQYTSALDREIPLRVLMFHLQHSLHMMSISNERHVLEHIMMGSRPNNKA